MQLEVPSFIFILSFSYTPVNIRGYKKRYNTKPLPGGDSRYETHIEAGSAW